MHLIIGLGPIGGNVGAHLVDKGREVYGYDLDTERVAQWAEETGSALFGSDLAAIDWSTVESVNVAVRLANQVEAVIGSLRDATDLPLTVFISTTLSPTDARKITSSVPENWRVFESPVSGGPQGARSGSLTIFLAGPEPTDAEASLLADEAGNVFHLGSYGQPATVKLLNNTLATYNLAATARMLNLAEEHGVPAGTLADVVAVSTGRSWMSDNLVDVQYDLLLKDVGLLRGELGALPVLDLADEVEETILRARRNLADND